MNANRVCFRLAFAPALCWILLLGDAPATLRGQAVAPAAKPAADSDATVKLDEFVVNSAKDVGYAATNAIGVTRTNTPLIEISQVVNVLTKEFLEDTAAGQYRLSLRLVGIYREEDMVNGIADRFAYFHRWNLSPSLLWRATKNTQVRLAGEFMHERGSKSWGGNTMLAPFVKGGVTTFGLLPRGFMFSDPQGYSENDKQHRRPAVPTRDRRERRDRHQDRLARGTHHRDRRLL